MRPNSNGFFIDIINLETPMTKEMYVNDNIAREQMKVRNRLRSWIISYKYFIDSILLKI